MDRERTPGTRAPEERNVVSEDSSHRHFAPPELRNSMEPVDYKHSVPPGLVIWLETLLEKQESSDLLHRDH